MFDQWLKNVKRYFQYHSHSNDTALLNVKATLHVFPNVESRDTFLNEHVGPDDIVMHGHGKESNHAE